MVSTRSTLESIEANLLESMGSRSDKRVVPRLSPVPNPQDAGRRSIHGYGEVDVDQVVPDPDQPRSEFAKESIDRLAASIRETGQLSPIRVRWSDELGKWLIIAGERRWRTTKRAGLGTIQCYFHEKELSCSQVLEQQLIENLLRDDLKPVEEARAFQRLIELNNWTGKQVAEALRIPASKVSRALALLRLPPEIQERVDAGKISARGAYELSKIDDKTTQSRLAAQVVAGKLTHDQIAKTVQQRRRQRGGKARGTSLTFSTVQGWKIVVSASRRGTYFEVEAALKDALDEVRHRIRNNVQLF